MTPPKNAHSLRTLVTAREAAEAFRVKPATIRRMARDGRIPSVYVGNALRFDVAELNAALTAHRPGERDATTY